MSTKVADVLQQSPPCMKNVWFHTDKPQQAGYARKFIAVYDKYHSLVGFYRPNPAAAPWHWQLRINVLDHDAALPKGWEAGQGYVLLNVWPHKNKVQINNLPDPWTLAHLEQILDYLLFDKLTEALENVILPSLGKR